VAVEHMQDCNLASAVLWLLSPQVDPRLQIEVTQRGVAWKHRRYGRAPPGRKGACVLAAPPCVCFRFSSWPPKVGMSPGGAGVAVEHKEATPVGEITDSQPNQAVGCAWGM
jgi:hypothetical protein